MAALTDQARVQALLPRPLTTGELARVDTLIDMASDAVIGATGQTFLAVDDDTVLLDASSGEIPLPQLPVRAVSSVIVDPNGANYALTADQWQLNGPVVCLSRYRFGLVPLTPATFPPQVPDFHNYSGEVQLTYSHGYATVPGDVQNAVASAVAGFLLGQAVNPDAVRRERFGDYSVDYHFRDGTPLAVALDVDPEVLDELEENYGWNRSWSPRVTP